MSVNVKTLGEPANKLVQGPRRPYCIITARTTVTTRTNRLRKAVTREKLRLKETTVEELKKRRLKWMS